MAASIRNGGIEHFEWRISVRAVRVGMARDSQYTVGAKQLLDEWLRIRPLRG